MFWFPNFALKTFQPRFDTSSGEKKLSLGGRGDFDFSGKFSTPFAEKISYSPLSLLIPFMFYNFLRYVDWTVNEKLTPIAIFHFTPPLPRVTSFPDAEQTVTSWKSE